MRFSHFAAAGCTLFTLLLSACASGPVDPENRDRSGAYDGIWVGDVAEPRASTVILPGNWQMSCDWEPHQIYLVIDDGRVQLGKLERKSAISSEGYFKYVLPTGEARARSGTMSGNSQFFVVFSGDLSGDNPVGTYQQYVESIGRSGCSSKIVYRRIEDAKA